MSLVIKSPSDLITLAEAAQLMRLQPRTVDRYRQNGKLPYVRYSPRKILFHRADIESFIEKSYREASDYLE